MGSPRATPQPKITFRMFDPLLIAAGALPFLAVMVVLVFAVLLFRNLIPPAFAYVGGNNVYLGATLYAPVYPDNKTAICANQPGQTLMGNVSFIVTERTALDVYYAVRRPPNYPGDQGVAAIYGPLNPALTGRTDSVTVPYAVPRFVGPLAFRISLPPLAPGPWLLEVTARDSVRGANSFVIPFQVDTGC